MNTAHESLYKTYIHIYTHISAHIHVCTYTHICINTCVHNVHVLTYVCMHMYAHRKSHTQTAARFCVTAVKDHPDSCEMLGEVNYTDVCLLEVFPEIHTSHQHSAAKLINRLLSRHKSACKDILVEFNSTKKTLLLVNVPERHKIREEIVCAWQSLEPFEKD